jgi:hypothetical protein
MGKVIKTTKGALKVAKMLTNTDISAGKRTCPGCHKQFTPKRIGRNMSTVCSAACGNFVANFGMDE